MRQLLGRSPAGPCTAPRPGVGYACRQCTGLREDALLVVMQAGWKKLNRAQVCCQGQAGSKERRCAALTPWPGRPSVWACSLAEQRCTAPPLTSIG